MTREELHQKYGINRLMPPEKLYKQLSAADAKTYEKCLQAEKEAFDHWDDKNYWKDAESDID